MIDKPMFTRGLTGIGDQLSQAVPPEKNNAYYLALGDVVTVDEWTLLTAKGIAMFGWGPFLPTVPDLLSAIARLRGEPSREETARVLNVEAADAYERVMQSGTYTAEGGTTWNYRTVAERCGRAAAEAFLAAGGPNAFTTAWDESRRRERFLAAYQQAAREEPSARLLPPGDAPKRIAAAEDPRITPAEAKGFLEKLREIIPADIPEAPKLDAFDVNASEERMRMLREQAERLRAEAITEPEVVES